MVFAAGGTARAAKNAAPGGGGGEEVWRGQWWEDLKGEASRRERSGCQGCVPGCVGPGFLPRVGLGQGLVEGNLVLSGGASSRDVSGQGTWFLAHTSSLLIPV